ncbi:hypothetical protein WR25_11516 [Diploscapter pachys]|uniref:Nuclear receptor domain-containing protein n=1 Tax=Diploscapter pachys TaxID=2018661 RepID=A0A2A2JK41_9BILA|nr:hypothetical protein WR25_11516 [Diploscapter pachys]
MKMADDDTSNRRVAAESALIADPERACKVCGDRANGYNFGVLTCESCKAFFRRNAAREEDIKCPFSGSCQMTSASRRFCQACRLQKCFAVGMSREWLMEQKPKIKRKKLKTEKITKLENEEEHTSDFESQLMKRHYNKGDKQKKNECMTPQFCQCICQCGFYPEGTRLSDANPTTPQSSYLSPSSHSSIVNHSLLDTSPPSAPHPSAVLPSASSLRPSDDADLRCSSSASTFHPQLSALLPSASFMPSFISSSAVPFYPVPATNYYPHVAIHPNRHNSAETSNVNSPTPLPMLPEQFAMRPFHDQETFIEYLQSLTTPDIQQELDKYRSLNSEERILLWELLLYDKQLREPLELPSNMNPEVLNDKVVYGGEVRRMTLNINLLAEAGAASDHFKKEQESFLNTFEARVRKSPSAMMCYLMTAIFRGEKVLHSKSASKIFDLRMKYLNVLKKILKEDFGEVEGLVLYTAMLEATFSFDRTQYSMQTAISDMERGIVEPLLNELIKGNKIENTTTSL